MLANYNKILPKIAVYATTRGRCWFRIFIFKFLYTF